MFSFIFFAHPIILPAALNFIGVRIVSLFASPDPEPAPHGWSPRPGAKSGTPYSNRARGWELGGRHLGSFLISFDFLLLAANMLPILSLFSIFVTHNTHVRTPP